MIENDAEARYRHLVESATDIIYTHDLDGRIMSINAAGEKLLGFDRGEAIGAQISEWIVPEHRERARAMTEQKLNEGGSTTYEVDVLTRNGRRVRIEVSTQIMFKDGVPIGVQGIARDITERRQASEALETSERYFRALLENAADAITIMNADGSIRYSSPSIERIVGYVPEERRGKSVFEIIIPEDQAKARVLFERLWEDPEATVDAVLRLRHRDGTIRHIQFLVRNLLADPVVAGIVVNWHDITEKVHAEDQLRSREHFFRSIIERSSDILIVCDADGVVRYVSPALQSLLGFRQEDVVGTTGMFLVHEDDVGAAAAMRTAIFERGEANANAVLNVRTASGEYRTLDVRARNLMQDPVFNGVVFDARDISESRRFQEALRVSEERFRKIIETSGEGIVICDPQGRLTFANERIAQMFGAPVPALIGSDFLDLVVPEQSEAVRTSVTRLRHTGKSERIDTTFLRADGTRLSTILSVSPLFDAQDGYVGGLAILTDITERKRLEEELRQSQKIEAVGRLAGGIAHDFNNLLTAIRGHVDLLLADVPTGEPIRDDIEEIRKASDRAAGLTQQLLAFSRRQLLQPKVIELDQIVAHMETLLRRLIGEDIVLVTKLGSNAARVRADRGQIEQVIMNLAVNSRDAMPTGGSLTLETDIVEIGDEFVRANAGARAGIYVRLLVTDTGSGMDDEVLSHLFEPFYTTKEVGKGTGLGLATVYGIVKQSGGYIRVMSRPDEGTSFEIMLPLVEEHAQPVREAVQTGVDGQGETVLVTEDEDAVRSLASRILRKRGYLVLEARHGSEALDIARSHEGRIDLLLTDVVMPVMGGRELGEQLVKLRPDIKVVFMSGYTGDTLLQRGMKESSAFLEKPFTPDGLATVVREALESD
jgi:two-component system, cell cycle sensor histidine kinase and response regulator CckA